MMRYQRVSPDCPPLSNGRKPALRTCKEDDHPENGRIPNFSGYESKSLRVRSPSSAAASSTASPSTGHDHHLHQQHHFPHFAFSPPDPVHHENHPRASAAKSLNNDINGGSPSGGGGDGLPQWGQNKRSRGSRTAGDESHARQPIKIQRRSSVPGVDKQAVTAAAAAMPPPGAAYSRGTNLRPCMPVRDSNGSLATRTAEERSGRPEKRSPPSPHHKAHRTAANGGSAAAQADAGNMASTTPSPEQQEAACAGGPSGGSVAAAPASAVTTERLNLDLFEWPRIYLSLSRKEKEEDFLAMKGSKLPQRSKKRPKNVDKTLQYCFPGMWLSDLTRGRYEVREKKCAKKKRRGLKGLESLDSDSE